MVWYHLFFLSQPALKRKNVPSGRKAPTHMSARKLKYLLRYASTLVALGLAELARITAFVLKRFASLIGIWAIRIATFIFLDSLLNLYFFALRLKKHFRTNALEGTQRLLNWFNTYSYRITILCIVMSTILFNVFTKPLSAEELKSQLLFNTLFSDENTDIVQLVEEGPLVQQQRILSYVDEDTVQSSDDFMLVPAAPDTDDDDVYATTEDESAVIAPIITSPSSAPTRQSIETYIVQEGDTVSTISQKFGINMNSILWQNQLSWSSTIRPGQQLAILPVNGVAHTVKSGESVAQIAKRYQVNTESVVEYNKLSDASDIRVGDVLIVPDGIMPTAIVVRPRETRTIPQVIQEIFTGPPIDAGTKLLWPLSSKRITQYFTLRHKGVDVGDKLGKPIYAAESGRVERAGWTRGYGYNVTINHGNGIQTLYAHSSRLDVRAGDTVTRGQVIALIGSTGWSTGPHLHFEVRINGRVVNPLSYVR